VEELLLVRPTANGAQQWNSSHGHIGVAPIHIPPWSARISEKLKLTPAEAGINQGVRVICRYQATMMPEGQVHWTEGCQ
jgi:hypothetical protein